MNKNYLLLVCVIFVSFFLIRCGEGGEMEQENEGMEQEMGENEGDEGVSQFQNIQSPIDAMNQYKNLLGSYAAAMNSGNTQQAASIKATMDQLLSFANNQFSASDLGAMMILVNAANLIQNGQNVNLTAIYQNYNQSIQVLSGGSMGGDNEGSDEMEMENEVEGD
jgi:hypothetical protein